jgi:hypothetical protein
MGLPVILIYRALNNGTVLNSANHLLQYQGLKLESTHVAIISHHCEYVSYHQEIKVFIED